MAREALGYGARGAVDLWLSYISLTEKEDDVYCKTTLTRFCPSGGRS
jgi:hypothetical protein